MATQDEPPHKLGRYNALSGWIFALTLVNIRQPAILATYLNRNRQLFALKEAVVDGISSAFIVWGDSTQDSSRIESFLNYTPSDADSEFIEQWRELIQRPSATALRDHQAGPENERHPARLFRCQPRKTKQKTLKYEA